MAKLHELLAVVGNLENQANKTRKELKNTFEKKRHLFEEKRAVFQPSEEGAQAVVESQSDIQTSVVKELNWIQQYMMKFIDAAAQVAQANTMAKADIILEDGTKVLENVPATTLLELEKRVAEVQELLTTVPTLDPAKGFVEDEHRSSEQDKIYKARPITKQRTKKIQKAIVLYDATEKHPAQTQLISEDTPVGLIQEQEWSGMITPIAKSQLLNKTEVLIRAIRQARSRANEIEADKSLKIGKQVLSFIFSA